MNYPEHDKLQALDGANNTVGEFIDWLESHGMCVAQWGYPVDTGVYLNLQDVGRSERAEYRALIEEGDVVGLGLALEEDGYEDAIVVRAYPALDVFDGLMMLPDPRYPSEPWVFVDRDTDRLWPVRQRTEELIGEFFDIDPTKLADEKDQMLAELRARA